jgi:hypothetical protein
MGSWGDVTNLILDPGAPLTSTSNTSYRRVIGGIDLRFVTHLANPPLEAAWFVGLDAGAKHAAWAVPTLCDDVFMDHHGPTFAARLGFLVYSRHLGISFALDLDVTRDHETVTTLTDEPCDLRRIGWYGAVGFDITAFFSP